MYGKIHNEDTKLKMNIANKGKNHPIYGKKMKIIQDMGNFLV
jgi:hypothetical protein